MLLFGAFLCFFDNILFDLWINRKRLIKNILLIILFMLKKLTLSYELCKLYELCMFYKLCKLHEYFMNRLKSEVFFFALYNNV